MKLQDKPTKVNANNAFTKEINVTNDTRVNANFGKRVREITPKSFSLSGILNFKGISKHVQFESSLERDKKIHFKLCFQSTFISCTIMFHSYLYFNSFTFKFL